MRKFAKEWYLLLFIAAILLSYDAYAQKTVGIGTINNLNANAVLHLVAPDSDQGLLIPSLSTAQRMASSFTSKLSTTDNGLLIFDKDERKFYYWKENDWVAIIGDDVGFILSAGVGININDDNQIENTGDTDPTNDVTIGMSAGGDLGGSYPNPVINNNAITRQKIANDAVDRDKIAANVAGSGLAQNADGSIEINAGNGLEVNADALQLTNTGVTSGTFGKINMVPQLIVDETGRISGITELPITVSPTGAAGGELSGTYPNPTISDDVIDSANIKVGTIITENLADGAINNAKMADNAITSNKIEDGTIRPQDIESAGGDRYLTTTSGGTVTWEEKDFIDNTLSTGNIFVGDGAGELSELFVGTPGNILIGTGATLQSIAVDGDISLAGDGTATILPNTITGAKIADNAVGTDEISDGTVNTSDLANNSVTTDKLRDANVTTAKLADESVTNLKILAEAVTEEKIANDAITSLKIADGAITNVDVNVAAAIAGTKVTPNFGAQNISTTGKATTNSTQDTDGGTTLTTKDYVDDKLSDILPLPELEDGNGITNFSYDGTAAISISIDNGAGLDFDGSGKLQLADDGVTTDKILDDAVTLDKIDNGGADQVLTTDGSGNPQYEDKDIFVSSSLGNGEIFIGNGGVATAQTIGGDATLASDGTLSLSTSGFTAGTTGGGGDYIESITLDTKGRVTNVVAGMPPSDERLKKNINPLQNTLEEILQLNGYQYFWKSDSLNSQPEIGVIAQEVAQVFPELVKERSDGYKGVNYNGLVAVLLEALKAQQKTIEQLAEENKAMQSDLEMIKAALGLDTKADAEIE